jgi:hypothetical protein
MRLLWRSSLTTCGTGSRVLTLVIVAVLQQIGCTPREPQTSDIERALSRVGSWKLNVAKSTYDSGPPPRNATRTIETRSNGTRQRTEGVDAAGNPVAYEYSADYDGKDYPLTGSGTPNDADSIALRRIDNVTVEATLKKDGAVVQTTRSVLSKDGKVLTYTSKGNAHGQPTSSVTVWERQ